MSSKKAMLIGTLFYGFMTVSAGAFYFISTILPDFAVLALIAALLMLNSSGFILFWSLTVEGNTWIARRLARENIGVASFHEPGAYFNDVAIDFSKQEAMYRGESYILRRDAIEYRANGIPYIHYNVGDSEPISVSKKDRVLNSSENTGFLRDMTTLIEYMMRNQMYRLLLILGIASLALIILAVVFIHFVSVGGLEEKVIHVSNQIAGIAKSLPTPTPSEIPHG